jgi:hypothetical protein
VAETGFRRDLPRSRATRSTSAFMVGRRPRSSPPLSTRRASARVAPVVSKAVYVRQALPRIATGVGLSAAKVDPSSRSITERPPAIHPPHQDHVDLARRRRGFPQALWGFSLYGARVHLANPHRDRPITPCGILAQCTVLNRQRSADRWRRRGCIQSLNPAEFALFATAVALARLIGLAVKLAQSGRCSAIVRAPC